MIEQYESQCPKCLSSGWQPEPYADGKGTFDVPCTKCGGRGSVPNDAGEALLEFISHHLDTIDVGCDAGVYRGRLRDAVTGTIRSVLEQA